MTHPLQTTVVALIVIVAVAWLVADRLRRRRAGSKCDSCGLAQAVRPSKSARPR